MARDLDPIHLATAVLGMAFADQETRAILKVGCGEEANLILYVQRRELGLTPKRGRKADEYRLSTSTRQRNVHAKPN